MICFNSVGCLWQFHGKNPVGLYPKLQSQPIGLPKIFIDYLFFQTDQSDCTNCTFLIDLLPGEQCDAFCLAAKFVALEFSHSCFRMAC